MLFHVGMRFSEYFLARILSAFEWDWYPPSQTNQPGILSTISELKALSLVMLYLSSQQVVLYLNLKAIIYPEVLHTVFIEPPKPFVLILSKLDGSCLYSSRGFSFLSTLKHCRQ